MSWLTSFFQLGLFTFGTITFSLNSVISFSYKRNTSKQPKFIKLDQRLAMVYRQVATKFRRQSVMLIAS
jgi:hypothetical protein